MREPRRRLKLYKTKLRQLHNYDKNLDICIFLYNPSISDYDNYEFMNEYTDLFNYNINYYEGLIKQGLLIRQFYYDDDEDNEYTDFIHNFVQ